MNIQRPLVTSLVDLLRRRAREQPDDRAYIFISDQGEEEAVLTFADLERRADAVAVRLAERGKPRDRALVLFPPGLELIVAYFGCLVSGVIAVPMMLPRRNSRDQSASILANCTPQFAITNSWLTSARADVIERFQSAGIDWLILDPSSERPSNQSQALPIIGPDDVAFLQYTSGSTSDPKGVTVTHGNLIENLEMIRVALSNTRQSTHVSWVPLYHDMGFDSECLAVALSRRALCLVGAGHVYATSTELAAGDP